MTKEKPTTNAKPSIPDSEIIERFGGIRPMASKLGVAVTTVQGWKERGHIPEGRLPQIVEAAAEHGIDIGLEEELAIEAVEPEAEKVEPEPESPVAEAPEEKEPAPEPEPEPELAAERAPAAAEVPAPPRPAGGVSWLALLVVAVLLGGAIVTGPLWQSKLYPGVAPSPGPDTGRLDEIAAGLAEIEAGLRDLARDIEARETTLSARIDALEAGGGETGEAFAGQLATVEQGVERLSGKLDALESTFSGIESRITGLEAKQGEVPESVKSGLQAIDGALGELRGEIADLGRAAGSLQDGLSSVGGNVGDLETRVAALEARPVQSGEKIAAMVLALGQVEAAMNSGRPYREALNRLEFLGRDDPLISEGEALATLSPWADNGIPDRLALRRRFGELAPEIDRALSGAEEGTWLDSVWNRISGLVTIRRIDGGDQSPLALAEQALEEGDLVAAAAAFDGKGSLGPEGDAWLNLVIARIEAEREITALYGQMIAPLAGEGNEGAPAQ